MRLEAKGLSYKYESKAKEVLRDLSFSIEPGSYWCVAGPNGSGKSTFLKLASGLLLLEQMKGELTWNGRALKDWPRVELARSVTFVPGGLKTAFPVSVAEFVLQGRYAHSDFWARPSGVDRKKAESAIERVGIQNLTAKTLTEISSGETQLALIARALAQAPKVLILDEATANLDLGHQSHIYSVLSELNRSGMTILLVSHDLNLAAEFCPNMIWLKDGSVYAAGSTRETLTTKLMQELYNVGDRIEVGTNPFTARPKIFWR